MKLISLVKNKALYEPTWKYLSDVAAFCALIYGSPNTPKTDPRALGLDSNDEEHSSVWEDWEPIEKELYDSIKGKWKPIKSFPNELPVRPGNQKYTVGGLVLDLWRTTDQDTGADICVLFFRGSDKESDDWWANFRWLTRFVPFVWDQYSQVIKYTSVIVDSILESHPNATILAAGHSLGGGLAQAAGYCSPHIQAVYAFNSSPVTGYFSIEKMIRLRSREDLVIFRVYEKGEGLAYARDFMRWLWPLSKKDPEIINVVCNFTKGNLIKKHGMVPLAHKLRSTQLMANLNFSVAITSHDTV